jgi:hypothetical protein
MPIKGLIKDSGWYHDSAEFERRDLQCPISKCEASPGHYVLRGASDSNGSDRQPVTVCFLSGRTMEEKCGGHPLVGHGDMQSDTSFTTSQEETHKIWVSTIHLSETEFRQFTTLLAGFRPDGGFSMELSLLREKIRMNPKNYVIYVLVYRLHIGR